MGPQIITPTGLAGLFRFFGCEPSRPFIRPSGRGKRVTDPNKYYRHTPHRDARRKII